MANNITNDNIDDTIQLFSNVKIITTGNKPTTANLLPGQAAFGKITEDDKYHFFGNSGEGGGAGKVVDIILDTIDSVPAPTLEDVIKSGDISTVGFAIAIKDSDGNVIKGTGIDSGIIELDNGDSMTSIAVGGAQFAGTNNRVVLIDAEMSQIIIGSTGNRTIGFNITDGYSDNNYPVLSSNPTRTYNAATQTQFRKALDILSKSEVQTLISGVYKIKGSVESFNALINNADYTPEEGDVWNIETAGGQDSHGQDIKAGDNVVFVGPNKSTDWDVLAGIVDLQGYYTKAEVDGIKTDLETKITAAKSAADAAQTTANQAKTTADNVAADYVKDSEFNTKAEAAFDNFATEKHVVKDANYVHTDNNYTDADKSKLNQLDFSGDGSKVVTDNGSTKTLNFNVVEI